MKVIFKGQIEEKSLLKVTTAHFDCKKITSYFKWPACIQVKTPDCIHLISLHQQQVFNGQII